MSRARSTAPGALKVQIVGRGESVRRLEKRLHCAAGALGLRLSVEHVPDDLLAAELGARRGPLVSLEGVAIADGAEPVEVIQSRMEQQLAHGRKGS